MRGLAKLNRYPRSASAPHVAQETIPTIVIDDDMPQCSSPTETDFIRIEGDGADGADDEIIMLPHYSGKAKDRREERSFQQATLTPVPSASSQSSSGRSSPYVVGPCFVLVPCDSLTLILLQLSIAPAEDHQLTYEAAATDSRSFTSVGAFLDFQFS